MKIHIVQHDMRSNRVADNLKWIKEELQKPESKEALLTVFPAYTLCGYPLFAAAGYTSLQKDCQQALQELLPLSRDNAFIIGLPLYLQDRGLCNVLAFLQGGAIRAIVSKKYLSTDEQRYFVRGDGAQEIEFLGENIAIGFYEDLKELERGYLDNPDVIICCGCNVFDSRKPYRTFYRVVKLVEKFNCAMVYVNRTGGEGSYLFAGGSLAVGAAGMLLCRLPYFEEATTTIDMQLLDAIEDDRPDEMELIYKALVMGIRDYFHKNGLSRAVLGLSGGIDSALVCTIAVDALGKENVHGILMPSQYSTDHSIKDAEDLSHNLGIEYDIVPIKPLFEEFKKTLKPLFGDRKEDVTEENMQARIRGTLLMSYANKYGALVLNTTNRSEAAMGYGTLYGDSCGSLSVIGDLYKCEVYKLSNYINRNGERIPQHSIDKAPSAELRPGQKDSDSLPDYDLLDAILSLYLDDSLSKEEIIEEGYDAEMVEMVIRKTNQNEWKRLQFAPQLKVSTMSFGLDRRYPIS